MKISALTKIKTVTSVAATALAVAITVSAASIGFASWRTQITGSGTVQANGAWDVKITDASLTTSVGAAAIEETSVLGRTNEKNDPLLASTISSYTWIDDASLMGTQSNDAMSMYTNYYAIDTSKYSVDTLKSYTTAAQMNAMRDDSSTLCIAGRLNAYYRYVSGQNDGSTAAVNASATAVMDGFISDTEALLKEEFPETYQNYTVVYISGLYSGTAKTWSNYCYTIAAFSTEQSVGSGKNAAFTDTTVNYLPIAYSMPTAWTSYSLTVTNNGTVAADLSNSEIKLNGDEGLFTLTTPDLSSKVLNPGESATIVFTVQVNDTDAPSISGTADVSVSLTFDQPTVSAAPSTSFTLN